MWITKGVEKGGSFMAQTCVFDWGDSTTKPSYFGFKPENGLVKYKRSYRVSLEKGQDGWIVAKCLDVKGAISQGKNEEEALRNIAEAISLILEDTYGDKVPEFVLIREAKW